MLDRLLPDRFILWLLAAVLLAVRFPVHGAAAPLVDALGLAAIFTLFLLHGARLPREAVVAGLSDWRLHGAILATTFVTFPLAGIALAAAFPGLMVPELWTGLIFLCVLPSTVQSAIAYTSIAGGNVAGAVAAAAFSQILGVALTPLLVAFLLQAQGAGPSAGAIGKLVLLLVLPFALGHLLRPWIASWVAARPRIVRTVDKGTILIAVYGAFSAATVAGVWSRVPQGELAILSALLLVLLAFVLVAAWLLGRLLGLRRENRAALLFCGSVKSLVSGVPMARILFPGPVAALVIVPIMLFHIFQLVASAWIAGTMGRRLSAEAAAAQP
jgi:sodium/bile acid cotransporter 7